MSLPIDRTAKTALDANLVNGNTSDAPVIKASNDVVYNTIDELKGYVDSTLQGIYDPNKFTRLGITNVKDFKASGSAQTTSGSITSGSALLTVASAIDFVVGQGITVSGNKESSSLTITAGATVAGNVTVNLDGSAYIVAVALNDTAIQVADKIRAASFVGWTTGGTVGTSTVTFTANITGNKIDATYSAGTTGAAGSMTTTIQGSTDFNTTITGINGVTFTLAANATTTATNMTVQHDDGPAIQAAIIASIGKKLVFPAGGNYRLGTGVSVTLSNNQFVYIDFQGSTLTFDTTSAFWEQIKIVNYTANNGCTIIVENFKAVGVNGVAATRWGAATSTYPKSVGFALAAQTCIIRNFSFSNIWGFAAKTSYVSDVRIYNGRVDNVGGHSYTYGNDAYGNGDAFGDCFYADNICAPANIELRGVIAVGMTNAAAPALNQSTGPVSNLSRIFLGVETSVIDGKINVKVSDCSASNFQRMFHFEGLGSSTVTLEKRDFTGNNGGVLVHNYQTGTATINVLGYNETYSQSATERFQNSYGLGGYQTANYFGGAFYNLFNPFDGNVNSSPGGYALIIEKATIYFNNSRFQGSISGNINCNTCNIFDYSADSSNPQITIAYKSCTFNTTISATYGLTISPSGGTENFLDCTFYNQQPSISNANNVIRNPKYINDSGSSGGMRLLSNAQNKALPKIWNCLYRFTDLGAANTKFETWINETGTIYAVTGTVALVAGANAYTVNTSTNLLSTSTYVIEIIPCGKAF